MDIYIIIILLTMFITGSTTASGNIIDNGNTTDNLFRDENKTSKLVDDLLNQTKTELEEAKKICGKNKALPNMYYSHSPNIWCHSA